MGCARFAVFLFGIFDLFDGMLAIRIHETGGVEKLRADDLPVPAPAAGEIRFRVEAAGVNFIDTYKRSGLYAVPLPHTPSVPPVQAEQTRTGAMEPVR